MKADKQLDISGIVAPICFLLCQSSLVAMESGDILEIRLCDPETLKDLITIVQRSADRLMSWEKQQQHYVLWVQKRPDRSELRVDERREVEK